MSKALTLPRTLTPIPTLPWYEWQPNRVRLETWMRFKARDRIRTLRLDPRYPGIGAHDPRSHTIVINPTKIGKTPRGQWRAARGVGFHEIGHVNFTQGSLGDTNQLHWLANALEDQRIEWLMLAEDPAVLRDLVFVHRAIYRGNQPLVPRADNKPDPNAVLNACLLHRFEWYLHPKRTKLAFNPATQALWDQTRPLVEEAWRATATPRVVEIARQILHMLRMNENASARTLPPFGFGAAKGTGSPESGQPVPPDLSKLKRGGASTNDAPQDQTDLSSEQSDETALDGSDDSLHVPSQGAGAGELPSQIVPQPYAALEQQALPIADRLSAVLVVPTPEAQRAAHPTRGRYSFRQEWRTPDTPFRARSLPALRPGLAVEIVGDRSGSMSADGKVEAARLGAMALHLACAKSDIAHAISLFEGYQVLLEYNGDHEMAKALIAGWDTETGTKFGDHLEWRARKLLARPEKVNAMFVIHDGLPADADAVIAFQRRYDGQIFVVGIYLTEHPDEAVAQTMRELFPRVVVATPRELPEQLGALLTSLRGS
jgi:hypothetical protein